jgi:type I restriction-modification system DNA methylase subunit
VIGNPPYVRLHNIEDDIKTYFWSHYGSFVGKSDLYCCFIERAISLLKKGGKFGNIISNGWLRLDSFEALRKQIFAQTSVEKIVDFTDYVFANATVKTCILLLRKAKQRLTRLK